MDLTEREKDIINLYARGISRNQVCDYFKYIAEDTCQPFKYHIYKLNVNNYQE